MSDPAEYRPADFQNVYLSTRAMVLALALQMLGDPAEAEDAAQSTFLQVLRFLPRFRGESSIQTWVYRIGLREASLRARQRSARRFRLAAEVVRSPNTSEVGPGLMDDLLAAMQRLNEDHRAVLSLLHLREIPVRQAADILGVPEGTVWSRAHAARRALHAIIESEKPAHESAHAARSKNSIH